MASISSRPSSKGTSVAPTSPATGDSFTCLTPPRLGEAPGAAIVARMRQLDPLVDTGFIPSAIQEYQQGIESARQWLATYLKQKESGNVVLPPGVTPLQADLWAKRLEARIPPTTSQFNERYRRLVKIGEGSFGDVYIVYDTHTKEHLAIKRMRQLFHDPQHAAVVSGVHTTIVREIKILRMVRHPNIVPLVDYHFMEDGVCVLFMPLVSHDLVGVTRWWKHCFVQDRHDRLKGNPLDPLAARVAALSRNGLMSLSYAKGLLYQLLTAVAYLHSWKIWHRDLKLSNLMMNHDGRLIVVDFGWSRFEPFESVEHAATHARTSAATASAPAHPQPPTHAEPKPIIGPARTGPVGTMNYRAPEILIGSPSSRFYDGAAVDLWAVGCIAFELVVGELLVPGHVPEPQDAMRRLLAVLGPPPCTSDKDWPRGTVGGEARMVNMIRDAQAHHGSRPPTTLLRETVCTATKDDGGRDSAYHFISHLLKWDPQRRMSAKHALEHPWFMQEPRPCPPDQLILPLSNTYSYLTGGKSKRPRSE